MDSILEGIVKGIFKDVILKVVISKITEAVPFLALPIINPLFGLFAGWIGKFFLDEMINMFEIKLIDYKVDGQKNDYNEAVEKLKAVVDKPDKTPEELEAAKNELKEKLHNLVSLKLG